ncbi:MAG: hypothetical protein ACRDE2_06730, partial [Chitinophagaceae bacterium]
MTKGYLNKPRSPQSYTKKNPWLSYLLAFSLSHPLTFSLPQSYTKKNPWFSYLLAFSLSHPLTFSLP